MRARTGYNPKCRIAAAELLSPVERAALATRVAAGCAGESFFPATRAGTYRQKMQRSFAAELLSPFAAVEEMLRGDFSEENQIEVARHFDVSELAIRTLLVNHGLIDRDALSMEMEAA